MSRSATGQFKESGDIGRSLKQDRQQKAKTKSGQGDWGDRQRAVLFSNRLGCADSLLLTRVDDETAVPEVCDDDGDVSLGAQTSDRSADNTLDHAELYRTVIGCAVRGLDASCRVPRPIRQT